MEKKRITKEEIWEKWGNRLKSISFYKSKTPKTHSEIEWFKFLDDNFKEYKHYKENRLPYSERLLVCRLYRFCYDEQ